RDSGILSVIPLTLDKCSTTAKDGVHHLAGEFPGERVLLRGVITPDDGDSRPPAPGSARFRHAARGHELGAVAEFRPGPGQGPARPREGGAGSPPPDAPERAYDHRGTGDPFAVGPRRAGRLLRRGGEVLRWRASHG